jgi:hypothetical protein
MKIDLNIISQIESDNNDKLRGKAGERGRFQIRAKGGILDDWNAAFKKRQHTPDQLEDSAIAGMIVNWWFEVQLMKYFGAYDIDDTLLHRILAYNWGIGNLQKWINKGSHMDELPSVSKRYFEKYLMLAAKK